MVEAHVAIYIPCDIEPDKDYTHSCLFSVVLIEKLIKSAVFILFQFDYFLLPMIKTTFLSNTM